MNSSRVLILQTLSKYGFIVLQYALRMPYDH